MTIRLIRSKGVGVFFATQSPTDVPATVLAQLGSRIQHALRAFTPDDADDLRKSARTFPVTAYYDVEKALTSLAIGEALVTVLSPRGTPTPLAMTLMIPPDSLMAALDPAAFQAFVAGGALREKYATAVDRESAHELISERIQGARAAAQQAAAEAKWTRPYDEPPVVSWEARQRRQVAIDREQARQGLVRTMFGTLFGPKAQGPGATQPGQAGAGQAESP